MVGLTPSATALLGLATGCGFLSWIFVSREIEDVNRKLPAAEQISLGYMYPGKMRKIKTAYRRLYPTGRIEAFRLIAQTAMFACLALSAIAAGFFR